MTDKEKEAMGEYIRALPKRNRTIREEVEAPFSLPTHNLLPGQKIRSELFSYLMEEVSDIGLLIEEAVKRQGTIYRLVRQVNERDMIRQAIIKKLIPDKEKRDALWLKTDRELFSLVKEDGDAEAEGDNG